MVTPNVTGATVAPSGPPAIVGVPAGSLGAVNPPQAPLSVLGNGAGTGAVLSNGVGGSAPEVNVVAPRGPLPFTGAVSNASGNKGLENASGLNPVAPSVNNGNAIPNLIVGGSASPATPSGSPATQGRAAGNVGSGNFSAVVPAATGTGAGGPAPGTVSGATTSTPPWAGRAPSGNPLGSPPGTAPGAPAFPPATGQSAPPAGKGISVPQTQKFSPTGLAIVAEDGVSTKIVPARPCSSAARETDGTTTCVGLPRKR
jgi:hypothetical protein